MARVGNYFEANIKENEYNSLSEEDLQEFYNKVVYAY